MLQALHLHCVTLYLLIVKQPNLAAGGGGQHRLGNTPDQTEEARRIDNEIPAALKRLSHDCPQGSLDHLDTCKQNAAKIHLSFQPPLHAREWDENAL